MLLIWVSVCACVKYFYFRRTLNLDSTKNQLQHEIQIEMLRTTHAACTLNFNDCCKETIET